MCVLLARCVNVGFRANNHGSNPHLCIILAFLPFKCGEKGEVKERGDAQR
jgi:hypothetical protein